MIKNLILRFLSLSDSTTSKIEWCMIGILIGMTALLVLKLTIMPSYQDGLYDGFRHSIQSKIILNSDGTWEISR